MAAAACTTSCTKDEVDITGGVAGIVTDARSGEPLSGVGITITPSGKTATTAADGRYEIQRIEAQEYSVQARKSGYVTDTKTITIRVGEVIPLNFLLTPSVPNIEVSHTELDFGEQNSTLSLDISNTGYAALRWEISEDVAWLSCAPSSGTLQPGESASVVLRVSRDGMERGNYSQTISIISNGGSQVVRVAMAVLGIALSVQPEVLDFGPISSTLPLTIRNASAAAVSYSLAASNDWILLPQQRGSVAPKSDAQWQISADRRGLSPGDYSGSITLTANGQQLNIPVRMNIPAKEKPVVHLSAITDVTYVNATFQGGIISVGSSRVTRYGFCWSKTENPTIDSPLRTNFGDTEQPADFSHTASGLEQSTTYYVRAYAENAEGVSYSNQERFVTQGMPSLAGVATGTVSAIGSAQAQISGQLLSLGNVEEITQYGHAWSVRPNPTIADAHTAQGPAWSTGPFTSTMSGLRPNVTYHVRAYATNRIGTAYGVDITFTTDYSAVQLTTQEAVVLSSKQAQVSVQVTDLGGHTLTECGICWAMGKVPSVSDNVVKASGTPAQFTFSIDGMKAEREHFVRAYARTARGDLYYGKAVSFITPSREVDITIETCGDEQQWNN